MTILRNFGPAPMQIKDILTRGVFYRPVDTHSVEAALKVKEDIKSGKNVPRIPGELPFIPRMISKIKIGHLLGIGSTVLFWINSVLSKMTKPKDGERVANGSVELLRGLSKGFLGPGLLAGLVSFLTATFGTNIQEESIKAKLDTLVDRYQVKADGTSTNLKQNVPDSKFPSLDNVVLNETNEEELRRAISLIQDQNKGGIFCLRGITRCGKTMTAKAIARELASRSANKQAQFWFASDEAMERNFADKSKFLGEILGIETTVKRLERLVANAILENDDVVIVLDEAHQMLGFEGQGQVSNYDPNNPNQTSDVIESLKKLFSEKVRTKKCGNVYLVLTANSSANAMAAPMRGRMDADCFYDKPNQRERRKLIKLILEDELKNKNDRLKLKIEDFSDKDLDRLSSIGTCNLLEKFGNTEQIAYEEAVRAGFGGKVEELRSRPMLHYELIEKVVRSSVLEYIESKVTGKEKLIELIESSLKRKLEAELNQRPLWEGELTYYFGQNKPNHDPMMSLHRGTRL